MSSRIDLVSLVVCAGAIIVEVDDFALVVVIEGTRTSTSYDRY